MCMMNLLARCELAGFDVQPNLLVGIAERHSLGYQPVHLLDREDQVVA